MNSFEKTTIAESIIDTYGEHRVVVHASEIPIGIMHFCSRNCAGVIGILEDGFILVESLVTKEVFLRYLRTGKSWRSRTFGLHNQLYGKN